MELLRYFPDQPYGNIGREICVQRLKQFLGRVSPIQIERDHLAFCVDAVSVRPAAKTALPFQPIDLSEDSTTP
jgi:hypothetical protein